MELTGRKEGTSKLDSMGTDTRRSWYICLCMCEEGGGRERGGEGEGRGGGGEGRRGEGRGGEG